MVRRKLAWFTKQAHAALSLSDASVAKNSQEIAEVQKSNY